MMIITNWNSGIQIGGDGNMNLKTGGIGGGTGDIIEI
jgi:hypothetical protein